MKRGIVNVFVIGGLILSMAGVGRALDQKYCPLCSMNLKMFWKTTQWLTMADGSKTGYCSLHCASKIYEKKAADIDKWEVADYDTQKLINGYKAHFLIGSSLPGTMTPVSKLAFGSRDTARQYQEKHGGEVANLEEALKRAVEGRGEDMAMIKKKVARMSAMGETLAGQHGCYRCHGEGGSGGTAVGWNTEEFGEQVDSKVRIKESVMGGSHQMKGYQGKLSEKELHAITLYVWSQRSQ